MTLQAPTLENVRDAHVRIAGVAWRTPLLPLQHAGRRRIYLKLENLQPIGSFKIRGAANAVAHMVETESPTSVVTASAGNFAQGLGYAAGRLGLRARSVVPQTADLSKIEALRNLGVELDFRSFEEWCAVIDDPIAHGLGSGFIHPFASVDVMAGNATIALELLEELPALDTIFVPYGGGGLAIGVAAAAKALKPSIKVVASEVATATPLTAALRAGAPVAVPVTRSFVSGIGARQVVASMWPLAQRLLDGTAISSVEAAAQAVRTLFERHHVVAEGAAAVPVAAALASAESDDTVACIVSGGHLDFPQLAKIIDGELP